MIRPIAGTDGRYLVSSDGYVIGPSGTVLKPRQTKGYLIVRLYPLGERYLHRLVAETFIPNPLSLPQVNHKDEDKLNCNVTNLEWCDGSYNQAYSNGKSVLQILNGNIIKKYTSHGEASRSTGIARESISRCTKLGGTCGGYEWRNSNED